MNPKLKELIGKAYKDLTEILISSLEKGEMNEEEMQESSRYIDYHLGQVQSTTELILLLRDICDLWKQYTPVFIQFKQNESIIKDQQKLEALQAKLRTFTNPVS